MRKRKIRQKATFEVPFLVPLPKNYRLEQASKGVLDGAPYQNPANHTSYADSSDPYQVAHEIGHGLDDELTPAERARFQRIMRLNGPWDQGTTLEGSSSSPVERFADYYAASALADMGHSGGGAYTVNKRRLKKFRKALNQYAMQHGSRQYGSDGAKVGRPPLPSPYGQAASQVARTL